MTVYLTDGRRHLVCRPYSVAGLHAMAADLNIARCWYHGGRHPHYDVPKRRVTEIAERCVVVSTREIIETIRSADVAGKEANMEYIYAGPVEFAFPKAEVSTPFEIPEKGIRLVDIPDEDLRQEILDHLQRRMGLPAVPAMIYVHPPEWVRQVDDDGEEWVSLEIRVSQGELA